MSRGAPEGRKMGYGRWEMGTKPLGSGAVDPATAGPRKGRHGFREEVASNGIWDMGNGILGLSRTAAAQQSNRSLSRGSPGGMINRRVHGGCVRSVS
jgi:hypothetical protein